MVSNCQYTLYEIQGNSDYLSPYFTDEEYSDPQIVEISKVIFKFFQEKHIQVEIKFGPNLQILTSKATIHLTKFCEINRISLEALNSK